MLFAVQIRPLGVLSIYFLMLSLDMPVIIEKVPREEIFWLLSYYIVQIKPFMYCKCDAYSCLNSLKTEELIMRNL